MSRGWQNGQQIEVYARRSKQARLSAPNELLWGADFVFDLLTFKVVKNRFGNLDLTPMEGCLLLSDLLNDPHSRILLLTD